MKINNSVLVGGGAGLVGLLLGLAIGNAGRSELEARAGRQDEIGAGVAALSDAVGAVDARVAALDARIGGVEGALASASEAQSGRIEELARRIEGVGSSLGGAVSDVGSRVTEKLSGDLDGLRAEVAESLRTQVAALAERAAASVERATAAGAAAAGPGEPLRIAHTASFGDGAVRVFLSAADRVRGTARVAVNGPELSTLTLGEPARFGSCELTLTGFLDDGATIAGDCGGATAAAVTGSGEGTSIGVAETAALADGKLRVFLSGIDAEAGTARVAVNGTDVTVLKMAEPVEAGGCTVTLTGLAAGAATIDAAC